MESPTEPESPTVFDELVDTKLRNSLENLKLRNEYDRCALAATGASDRVSLSSNHGQEEDCLEPYRSVSGYFENGILASEKTETSTMDTSYLASPSTLESTSLNNVLPPCELENADDLWVSVDKPEKVLATLDTYVTFRVSVKTKRPGYSQEEYCNRRRYSDFTWLRQRLEQTYSFALIPPLPEKHFGVYSLDRYDPVFIRARMLGLDIFLKRLARHPTISRNTDLYVFLTADVSQWSKHKKLAGSSVKNSANDAWQNLATSCFNFDRDPEFAGHLEYVFALGQQLLALEKALLKVYKRDQDSSQDLGNLAAAMDNWSEVETSLSLNKPITAIKSAIDTCLAAQDSWVSRFGPSIGAPLHEWILYTDVVKRREYIEMEHNNHAEALKKKRTEREQLSASEIVEKSQMSNWFGRDAENQKDQRLMKMSQQIEELCHKVKKWDLSLTNANGEIRVEMNEWLKLKDVDMSQWLRTLASERQGYYKQCLSAWNDAVASISNIP